MAKKVTTTWVLLADGAHAKAYATAGALEALDPTPCYETSASRERTRDLVSDRPGRFPAGGTGGHHAMEPRTDPHRHHEETFIKSVAAAIGAAAERNAFDRLVLVAPPRALGDLRRELPKRALERVVAELDRDLVQLSAGDVARHLAGIVKR